MGRRVTLGAAIVALAAAGSVGAVAIAGGDDAREAERTVVAEPMVAQKAGSARRAGGAEIQTFYLQNKQVPGEGLGVVVGVKCPKGQGRAIGGGAATDEGIVVSYLSQVKPGGTRVSERTYYVGVDDNAGDVGAGAFIEVYCAEKISVKK